MKKIAVFVSFTTEDKFSTKRSRGEPTATLFTNRKVIIGLIEGREVTSLPEMKFQPNFSAKFSARKCV